jgi:hypothetical protein
MGKPKSQTSPYEHRLGRAGSRRKRRVPRSSTSPPQRYGHRGGGDDDDEAAPRRYVTGPMLLDRYRISDMSLWRWLQDPALNFPQPALRIRGRRYWLESDLIAWERSQLPHGDDAVSPQRPVEREAGAPPT